jgi:uncharacterized protein YbcI
MPDVSAEESAERSSGRTDRDVRDAHAGSVSMAISREMVGLMKEYIGRGPTRARTYMSGNVVVCLMQDTMTKAEHSLARSGKLEAVRHTRRLFQEALREEATALIERLTGRKVVSFMSDHDIERDFASELFVLEDAAGEIGGP